MMETKDLECSWIQTIADQKMGSLLTCARQHQAPQGTRWRDISTPNCDTYKSNHKIRREFL